MRLTLCAPLQNTVVDRRVCDHFLALLDELALGQCNVTIVGASESACRPAHHGAAATTSSRAACDPDFLRNGRFSQHVELHSPTPDAATCIVQRRLDRVLAGCASTSDRADQLAATVAQRCKGVAGADLERYCDMAALQALQVGHEHVCVPPHTHCLQRGDSQLDFAVFKQILLDSLPVAPSSVARDVMPSDIGGLQSVWKNLFIAVVEPLRDWLANGDRCAL